MTQIDFHYKKNPSAETSLGSPQHTLFISVSLDSSLHCVNPNRQVFIVKPHIARLFPVRQTVGHTHIHGAEPHDARLPTFLLNSGNTSLFRASDRCNLHAHIRIFTL